MNLLQFLVQGINHENIIDVIQVRLNKICVTYNFY